MPIDLTSLRKLETQPASSLSHGRADDERMVVIVKLKPCAARPGYLAARAEISQQIFTVEVPAADLSRLEADPDIESVSVPRALPMIQ